MANNSLFKTSLSVLTVIGLLIFFAIASHSIILIFLGFPVAMLLYVAYVVLCIGGAARKVILGWRLLIVMLCGLLVPPVSYGLGQCLARYTMGIPYLEREYIKHEDALWRVSDALIEASLDSCRIFLERNADDSVYRAIGLSDPALIAQIRKDFRKTHCNNVRISKIKDYRRVEFKRHYVGLAAEGFMFIYDGTDAKLAAYEYGTGGVADAAVYSDRVLFTVASGAV